MKIEHEYVTLEEVYTAYYDCRKHKSSTHGYIEYSLNYISNNYQLYAELNSGAYRIGKSKAFCVTRPKLREVFCAAFRDRIVHHLLALKFGELLDAELTDKAYACRKGKGTDYGIDDVRAQIERVTDGYKREAWILKCDLQGFFMSIDRRLLFGLLERTIRGKYKGENIEWWMNLWRMVVLHDPAESCIKWVTSPYGISCLRTSRYLPAEKAEDYLSAIFRVSCSQISFLPTSTNW